MALLLVLTAAAFSYVVEGYRPHPLSSLPSSHRGRPDPSAERRRHLQDALISTTALIGIGALGLEDSQALAAGTARSVADIDVALEGKMHKFREYLGPKLTLVANTASYCALTDGNNKGLVSLYERYHDKGLNIVAVPSNEFAYQDPDESATIRKNMCGLYGVEFPILDKQRVQVGPQQDPLFATLTSADGMTGRIEWNYAKFLLDADGVPIRRYKPGVYPMDSPLQDDIDAYLTKGTLPPKRPRSLNDF